MVLSQRKFQCPAYKHQDMQIPTSPNILKLWKSDLTVDIQIYHLKSDINDGNKGKKKPFKIKHEIKSGPYLINLIFQSSVQKYMFTFTHWSYPSLETWSVLSLTVYLNTLKKFIQHIISVSSNIRPQIQKNFERLKTASNFHPATSLLLTHGLVVQAWITQFQWVITRQMSCQSHQQTLMCKYLYKWAGIWPNWAVGAN